MSRYLYGSLGAVISSFKTLKAVGLSSHHCPWLFMGSPIGPRSDGQPLAHDTTFSHCCCIDSCYTHIRYLSLHTLSLLRGLVRATEIHNRESLNSVSRPPRNIIYYTRPYQRFLPGGHIGELGALLNARCYGLDYY